jgi:hypothetical protein
MPHARCPNKCGPNKHITVKTSALVLRTKVILITSTPKILNARLAGQVRYRNRGQLLEIKSIVGQAILSK